jgi:hypothetical protein
MAIGADKADEAIVIDIANKANAANKDIIANKTNVANEAIVANKADGLCKLDEANMFVKAIGNNVPEDVVEANEANEAMI